MTTTEVLTIVGCLVLGYWIVAVLVPTLKGGAGEDGKTQAQGGFDRAHKSTSEAESGSGDGRRSAEPEVGEAAPQPWHEVLEIAESSSSAEISAAYKRKIRQYHPDKVAQMGQDIRDLAEFKAKQINVAYAYAMRLRGL